MTNIKFNSSRLTITNGLTIGYRRRPKHIMLKTLVSMMTIGTLGYAVIDFII
jgi:hypothetical protein